jgi:ABC-type uncharacterized transport system substrate-binding protein
MHSLLCKIIFSLLVFFPMGTMAAENYTGKKILFIDSYHAGFEWSDGIARGARDVLEKTGVELKVVHMDTKRNASEVFIKSAALEVKAVIEKFKPDVVIASDDNASKYLIVPYYKNADLPVVFCAVNWDASVYGFPCKNVTGMVEVALIPEIIKHLKRYAKGNRIGFIAADRLSAKKEYQYHRELLNIGYTQAYFAKNFQEWREMFLKLQDEVDMAIMLNHVGIADWNHRQAQTFVEDHTKIPMGARNRWDMPFSLIGIVNIPDEQGAWAAHAALKILEGVPPSKIPLTRNKQGKLFFNLRIGQKLGITTAPPFATLAD